MSEFEEGVALFKQQDFSEALARFLAAKDAGMAAPKLDYNIALCQFRLQRYDAAREMFLKAAKYPSLRDIAHYNVGLLEQARGNETTAREWFQRVYDDTSNRKLKTLAGVKLGVLRFKPSIDASGNAIWTNGYSLSLGYDDNIEDPAAPAGTTGKGDAFSAALLYSSRVQRGGMFDGLHLGLLGYLQHYQTVTAYDLNLIQFSVGQDFTTGTWNNRIGVALESTTLGGESYLQTSKWHLTGKLPLSATDELRLRYRYSSIDALLNKYDYLSGSRHEVDIRWQRQLQDLCMQAIYGYDVDQRTDFTGATTFTSYSPTRHSVELRGDLSLDADWDLGVRAVYRTSEYNDANILTGGSQIIRKDERVLLGGKVTYVLSSKLDLEFEYKYTDNNSNITRYDYSRNLYSVGLSGRF